MSDAWWLLVPWLAGPLLVWAALREGRRWRRCLDVVAVLLAVAAFAVGQPIH